MKELTILNKIIVEKEKEVALLKEENVLATEPVVERDEQVPTFRELVLAKDEMSIIAEIKRASPSKGVINDGVDPIKQAKTYADNGVGAISVLTDTPFFQGTMADLRAVRTAVDVPVLNKDFIIDPIQIDRAAQAGANVILLIAAALDDEKMAELFAHAKDQDLEVLCEVHNEEEMERVLRLDAQLIGINNRNLKTFEVDLATTTRLANMITDPETILVSESGIESREDVEFVRDAGARAILVGETFMRAERLRETILDFQVPLRG